MLYDHSGGHLKFNAIFLGKSIKFHPQKLFLKMSVLCFLIYEQEVRKELTLRTAEINCPTYKLFCFILSSINPGFKKGTFLIIYRRSI